MSLCSHLTSLSELKKPAKLECPECVALGDTWVHLRTCQTCGGVHCCDQSKNQHARKHYHATQHPVVTSAQPHEQWAYCWVDDEFAEY